MINLAKKTIQIPGKEESKIKDTAVWWLGPLGFVLDLETVHKQAELLGLGELEIPMTFKAIPVAIGEDGSYEELR